MNNPMDDVFPALGVNDLSGDPTVPPYIPIHAEVETNRQTRDGSLIESTSLLPSRSASSLSKTARPKTQKGDNKSCEVNYNQCSYHHCTFMLSASGDHGTDTSGTQKKIGGLSPCIPEERTQDIAAEGGNSPREIDVREQRFEVWRYEVCRKQIVLCGWVCLLSDFTILAATKLLVISRSVSTTKFVFSRLNFLSLASKWDSRCKYSVNFLDWYFA